MIAKFYSQNDDPQDNPGYALQATIAGQNMLTFHIQRDMTGKNSSIMTFSRMALSDQYVQSIVNSQFFVFSFDNELYVQAISAIEEKGSIITLTGVDLMTFIFNQMLPMNYRYPNPLDEYSTSIDALDQVNFLRSFVKHTHTLETLLNLIFTYQKYAILPKPYGDGNNYDSEVYRLVKCSFAKDEYKRKIVNNKYLTSFLNIGLTNENDSDLNSAPTSDSKSEPDNISENATIGAILKGVSSDLGVNFTPQYSTEYDGTTLMLHLGLYIDEYPHVNIQQNTPRIDRRHVVSTDIKVDKSKGFTNVAASGNIYRSSAKSEQNVNTDGIAKAPVFYIGKYTKENILKEVPVVEAPKDAKIDLDGDKINYYKNANTLKMAVLNIAHMAPKDFCELWIRYGIDNKYITSSHEKDANYSIDPSNGEKITQFPEYHTLRNLPVISSKAELTNEDQIETDSEEYDEVQTHNMTFNLWYQPKFVVPLPEIASGDHRIIPGDFVSAVKDATSEQDAVNIAFQYIGNVAHQDPDYILFFINETDKFKGGHIVDKTKKPYSNNYGKVSPEAVVVKKDSLIDQVNMNLTNINDDFNNVNSDTSVADYFGSDMLRNFKNKNSDDKTRENSEIDVITQNPAEGVGYTLTDDHGSAQFVTSFHSIKDVFSQQMFIQKLKVFIQNNKNLMTVQASINSEDLFKQNANFVKPGNTLGFAIYSPLINTHTLYTLVKSVDYNVLNPHLSNVVLDSVQTDYALSMFMPGTDWSAYNEYPNSDYDLKYTTPAKTSKGVYDPTSKDYASADDDQKLYRKDSYKYGGHWLDDNGDVQHGAKSATNNDYD